MPTKIETVRIEAFSDAVFAIVITLLALDLKVPPLESTVTVANLLDQLLHRWPVYLAFVTSFATILIMWIHHHAIFEMVHKSSTLLKFSNGFLLMLVTVVPFSTALVSEYLDTPAGMLAAAIYAGLFVLIDLSYTLLFWSASHQGKLIHPNVTKGTVQRFRRNYLLGLPLYVVAAIAAIWNPYISIGICFCLWIFWALAGGRRI